MSDNVCENPPPCFPRREPTELATVDATALGSSTASSNNPQAPNRTPSTPRKKRKRDGLKEEIRLSLLSELKATTMPLPSDYHRTIRAHPAMAEAVKYERALREGYATEALDDLRLHLTTHAGLKDRRQQASGVKSNTNWDRRLAAKIVAINSAKERYREERRMLLLLGMAEDDSNFKRLTESDCKAFAIIDEEQKLGDSRKRPSWIWGDFAFMDRTDEEGVKSFLLYSKLI